MFWNCSKKHVPKARGPYVPGCCDFMTGYGKGALFIRLYYPTSEENIDKISHRWPTWLPHDGYVAGIAGVLNLWPFIVRTLVWLMSGTIYVPAVYGAKFEKANKKLGTIVLSHGLGGNRFLYTATCIELASHGFVVFALEHRDGSACRTYYYENENDVKCDMKTFIEHEKIILGSSHYMERNRQVHARKDELKRALDLVYKLDSGDTSVKNILTNLPKDLHEIEFELSQLKDRLDTETITMMGHSFGAATALVTLASEPKRFKQGVLLDTWMFPVKDEKLAENIVQPLTFVNTQTFQIASNVKSLKPLLEKENGKVSMYTLLNTTHESQTDSTFVIGHWLNWFMKKLDPASAVRITCSLVLNFLKEQTNKYPEDVNELETYLQKNAQNYYDGLTRPWA